MKAPDQIPMEVLLAIRRKFYPNQSKANDVIRTLQWDALNGHYFFWHAGMYHGIELDGYIHT